jgi:pSer/pThr/pTyr-binding forkhead associated (FHA) protein
MSEHLLRNAHLPLLKIYKDGICLQEVRLENNIVSIGRGASNQVRLGDLTVSRNHARLLWREERRCYYVEELQSTNGVFLNDRRLHGSAMLVDGDRFRVGVYDIGFVDRAAAEKWATTMIEAMRAGKAMPKNGDSTRLPPGKTRRAILLREENGGVHLLISDRVTIGKSSTDDIKVSGAGVAKHQAVIARRGKCFYLLNNSDLPNITVNGRPVTNVQLEFNDRIEIGNSRFIFREI